MSKQLNVSLGLRQKLEGDFNRIIADMNTKFKNNQGIFQGARVTFDATDGHPDQPTKRQSQIVASTVEEQFDWVKKYSKDFLDTVLSIEKTNATGLRAALVVKGETWGTYTTLELLRLKRVVDQMKSVIQIAPIRPEGLLWSPSTDPVYQGRQVFSTPIEKDSTTTTIKRIVIVEDIHQRENPQIVRPPVTQQIDTPVTTGNITKQYFSGAITNRQRAELEVACNELQKAITEALEVANSTELMESDLGDKFLNYLFK